MVTDVTPHREDSPDVEPAPRAGSHRRSRRPRAETALRREAILQAAMVTFGAKGYYNGSLVEVADQVGMTHAGVLHHFGSKDQLLLEVLEYRDRTDVEHLEGRQPPTGLGLFHHLVRTARLNSERPGIADLDQSGFHQAAQHDVAVAEPGLTGVVLGDRLRGQHGV